MSAAEQVQEQKPETVVVGKAKSKGKTATGDLFFDTAAEIQSMSKPKALGEAEKLNETIEVSYLRLGGVLKLIQDNSWFEGFESFDAYVEEKFGFKSRKARYLIDIYDHLIVKQIPWEKVSHLGWTKLKDLAEHLTLENLDEMVAKAEGLTVVELQKLLKGTVTGEAGETSSSTTSDNVSLKFAVKNDQANTIKSALSKAKAETGTEFDSVALENICAGYLAGVIGGATGGTEVPFEEQVKTLGFEAALTKIAELFPEWDIEVKQAVK